LQQQRALAEKTFESGLSQVTVFMSIKISLAFSFGVRKKQKLIRGCFWSFHNVLSSGLPAQAALRDQNPEGRTGDSSHWTAANQRLCVGIP
jgi:hypothetical protein